MRWFRLFAATSILLVAANVFAAKTDIVVLKNGDRFTGEVKSLSFGQLELSTDDAGTIYIEWDKIASVTTAGVYEVVTTDGTHYVGTLAPDPGGTVQIVAADGATSHLAFLDVVGLARINSRFFQRFDGGIDFGGSYTKSSGVGQFSFGVDATYRRPRFEVFNTFESNLTTQSQADTTSRFTYRSGYTRVRSNDWLVSPFAFLERNPDLGLTLRTIGALAIGRYVQRSTRSSTLLAGGMAVGSEKPIAGGTILNVDALISFATSFTRYDYPKRSLGVGLLVFPELNRWGRVRANANVRFKYELFHDFVASFSLYDTFDNQPQVPDVSTNDFGVTYAIGWTF